MQPQVPAQLSVEVAGETGMSFHLGSVGCRLVSIAAHVDLLNFVRYLLLLQLDPNLLAVRTPGSMVSASMLQQQ